MEQAESFRSLIDQYGCFKEQDAALCIKQALQGLGYLHQCGIVHGSLRASNVFVDLHEGVVNLSEFGLHIPFADLAISDLKYFYQQSTFWMTPEGIELASPTTAGDIWSIGVFLLELLTGNPPFSGFVSASDALYHIAGSTEVPLPSDLSSVRENHSPLRYSASYWIGSQIVLVGLLYEGSRSETDR